MYMCIFMAIFSRYGKSHGFQLHYYKNLIGISSTRPILCHDNIMNDAAFKVTVINVHVTIDFCCVFVTYKKPF